MGNLRRALVFASADRAAGLIINLFLNIAISRLLTPSEVGAGLIGVATAVAAIGIREFATPAYLVQKPEIGTADVHTTTALNLILAMFVVISFAALAPVLARIYGDDRLLTFFAVVAVANVVEAAVAPMQSLLQRELKFQVLAAINVAGTITYAIVALITVNAGGSFLCFAFAWMSAAFVTALLLWRARPGTWSAGLSFERWQTVMRFGGYHGISSIVYRIWDAVPALALGRFASTADAGFFGRAQLLSQLIDKIFVSALTAVALPAFSAEARAGQEHIAKGYLHASTLISGVYWPAAIMLAILADPVTRIILGNQWLAAVPMVRIIAVAAIFASPAVMIWPALVAAGGIRERLISNLVCLPLSALIFIAACQFGVIAAALSLWLIMPFQLIVQIHYLQRHVPVTWRQIGTSSRPSILTALATTLPPLLLISVAGFDFVLGPAMTAAALVLAACGWVIGITLTAHPIVPELLTLLRAMMPERLARMPAIRTWSSHRQPGGSRG